MKKHRRRQQVTEPQIAMARMFNQRRETACLSAAKFWRNKGNQREADFLEMLAIMPISLVVLIDLWKYGDRGEGGGDKIREPQPIGGASI